MEIDDVFKDTNKIKIDDIFKDKDKIKEIFKTPELKVLKDEEANYVKFPIRVLRDETTSTFTEFFLGDVIKRKNFISYTFHTINTHIQLNINKLLIDDNVNNPLSKPLSSKEAVYLVFKGGNVMNYYFTKVINPINIDDTNYKISDVDYSIYIKTTDLVRFNIIKKAVYTLLIEALTKISNKFNDLYTKKERPIVEVNNSSEGEGVNNTLQSLIEGLKIFSDINEENYSTRINDILKKCIGTIGYQKERIPCDGEIIPDNKYILELLEKIKELKSTKHLIDLLCIYNIFIKCLYYYETKKQIKDDNILTYLKNIIKILYTLINNFVDNKLSKKINNFYNVDIDDFFKKVRTKVITKINNLTVDGEGKKLYEVLDGNLITYIFPKDSIDNIDYECKSDGASHSFITSIKSNETKIKTSKYKYQHYISYNSIIYSESIEEPVESNVKFDLARIKFNVELNVPYTKKTEKLKDLSELPIYISNDYTSMHEETKCDDDSVDHTVCEEPIHYTDEDLPKTKEKEKINIPSEFIDVSIPDFIDGTGKHYISSLSLEPHRLVDNDHDLHVYSYSVLQIAEDLENVLFIQNLQILPWLDSKYAKRLDRLVLFLLLSYYSNEFTERITDKYDFILRIYDLCEYIISNQNEDITELCKGTFDSYNTKYYNLSLPYDNNNYINPTIKKEHKLNIYGNEIFISLVKHYNMFKPIKESNKENIVNNYNMLRWRLVKYPSSTEDEINESYEKIMKQKEQFTTFINDLKNTIGKYIGSELSKKDKKTIIVNEDTINEKIQNIIKDLLKYGFSIKTTPEGGYSIVIANKYKNKYIKYKHKYLMLKKELNIN